MRSAAIATAPEDAALANDYADFIPGGPAPCAGVAEDAAQRLVASHGLAPAGQVGAGAGRSPPAWRAGAGLHRGRPRARAVPGRCGRWPRYEPTPRAASPRCRRPPTTSACTSGACARRCRAATGPALAAIRRMGEKQRGDSRWTQFEARTAELTGDRDGAQALYRKAAAKPDFHGFLAADRLDQALRAVPWLPRRRRAGEGGGGARRRHRPRDGAVPRRPQAMGPARSGTTRWTTSTTASAAWPWRWRRTTAGSTAACSAWSTWAGTISPRRRGCTTCASRCTTPTRSAARPRATASTGLGGRGDPRRKRVRSQRAVVGQRDGPDAGAARNRRRRGAQGRAALGRRAACTTRIPISRWAPPTCAS